LDVGSGGDGSGGSGGAAGSAAPTDAGLKPTHLVLRKRLGSGGTSDVYEDDTGLRLVKTPRAVTASVLAQFVAEADALRQLQLVGAADLARTLLGTGWRRATERQPVGQIQWPVLILQGPAGLGLVEHLQQQILPNVADASPAAQLAARCDFASAVVRRVLRVLKIAHQEGLVHCDVRPANIVVDAAGQAVLIDWGISMRTVASAASAEARARACAVGVDGAGLRRIFVDDAACRGVMAFAADGVFTQASSVKVKVGPHLDLASVAYTWLAIAYGDADCVPPWGSSAADALEIDRRLWLQDMAAKDARIDAVARYLGAASAAGSGPGPGDAVYAWPL